MDKRKIEEKIFYFFMIVATVVIITSLGMILITVVMKGLPAMNLSMVTEIPKGGYYLGKEGGILNAIIGSIYLAGGATVLAIAVSFPIVIYLNVYARKNTPFAVFSRFSLDVLWGVPSIVYGAFGFTIMLFLGFKASLLAGIVTLALLMVPIMSRAMDEVVKMVPPGIVQASYVLGATKLETSLRVVIRQTLPGLLTAVLIAFGRGIGDAASVIFTAGFADSIPDSFLSPAASLPLAIFFQLGTPFPEVQERAYASALILTVIILIISIIMRVAARRFTKHIIK